MNRKCRSTCRTGYRERYVGLPRINTSGQSNLTKRSHRRRTWTVQPYSQGGANMHPHPIHASLNPPESTLHPKRHPKWSVHSQISDLQLSVSSIDGLIDLRFYVRQTQNRSFRRRSSQPISWFTEQEGQHPLTGQRAANFRLLANQ